MINRNIQIITESLAAPRKSPATNVHVLRLGLALIVSTIARMHFFAAKEPNAALWPQPMGDAIAFHFVRRLQRLSQIANFATARLGSGNQ